MKRFKKIDIRLDTGCLELHKSKKRPLGALAAEAIFLMFWYGTLINQDIALSGIESYFVFMFYLAPLFRLPTWIKRLKTAAHGEVLIFDKGANSFSVNGRVESSLKAIEKVELNYDLGGHADRGFLDLRYTSGQFYRVEESDAWWDEEIIEAGKLIAGFLAVEIVSHHPYAEKL